ncbi:alpha/beta fold hydrolase [Marivibrio halodurans]|nr:alpha/beta fold hydrolase [Marivibrio halodurans]
MSEPRLRSVRCVADADCHRMVYDDYGPLESPHAVVCVHGLTRNAGDFERLARALAADGWRVLAPDIAGRGRSERLADPQAYGVPQYVRDIVTMLAHARVETVDWIGTSMGGLIGMGLAVLPGHPVRRMLLNDVGPRVPKAALRRIADYVGVPWRFEDFEDALAHLRKAYEPFGLTEEADWRELARISLRREEDGTLTNNYDLRIAAPFEAIADEDLELWDLWDGLRLTEPPMVLRGARSDLLLAEDIEGMTRRGPGARPMEIEGCGHAPTLMVPDQIALVRGWLGEKPAPGAAA